MNVHDVRQFLGLITYYRRFVRGFAAIAAPLHGLLKKADAELRKKKFRLVAWTKEYAAAFARLKLALTTAPVVR